MERRRPRVRRLLLLAALLLGIVTMHTLGHPAGGHEGRHGSAPMAARQLDRMVVGNDRMAIGHDHAVVGDARTVIRDLAPAAGGMDPMAVCLAVLAGWTLVLLVARQLLRRSGDPAAAVRARLLRAVRALPPPLGGRILLTRLSVLRQ
ncbi:hypothetical protein [Kitasatospora sp. NPDC097643]|uniref:DUF6153 family protein n=1 Tax=Kitasatospora sp. NPDC097643 TaxID=3157230 RepID=UPI00332961D8